MYTVLLSSIALDGTPNVPFISILCMATALVMTVVAPIIAVRFARKTYYGKYRSLLFGMVMYILFDTVLFSVVMLAWSNIKTIGGSPVFMAIMASVLSGAIGVVGRTIAIYALSKSTTVPENTSLGNAVMSGVGYSFLEVPAMLISMGSNLIIALTINMFGVAYLADDMKGDEKGVDALLNVYEGFLTTPSYEFLVSGFRIALIFILSISVSIVIYAVFYKKAHQLMLLFITIINILAMLPVWMSTYNIGIKNQIGNLILMTLFVCWAAILAYRTVRVPLREEIEERELKEKGIVKKAFPDFNANIKK